MQDAILKKLRSTVGDDNLVVQQDLMEEFLSGPELPSAVIFPGGTKEVSEIISLCNELDVRIGVGGHTVNTRGLDGGLAMVMSRMNRVLDIDHENLVAEVEAGTSHTAFQNKIAGEGLYFPPEPFKGSDSSIGACISSGDLDSMAFQYGPPRAYVLGFDMVLPTGEILNCGSKVIKNVSGYDLIHFVVGSRGTLGVITRVLLKLLPLPETRRSILGSFSSIEKAASVMGKLLDQKIYPARLNLLNAPVAAQLNLESRQIVPGHLVLVDLEGLRNSTIRLSEEVASLFRLEKAADVIMLDEDEALDNLGSQWLKLKEKYHGDVHERAIDFLVGPDHAPQALNQLEKLVEDLDSRSGLMVYALNGNIRVFPSEVHEMTVLVQEINRLALSLGGNIAGDLGYRLKCEALKEKDMWLEMVALTDEIRNQFDPNGILAPGVNQ